MVVLVMVVSLVVVVVVVVVVVMDRFVPFQISRHPDVHYPNDVSSDCQTYKGGNLFLIYKCGTQCRKRLVKSSLVLTVM
jgi:hypothetical protein